jgi:hypothetical protein
MTGNYMSNVGCEAIRNSGPKEGNIRRHKSNELKTKVRTNKLETCTEAM